MVNNKAEGKLLRAGPSYTHKRPLQWSRFSNDVCHIHMGQEVGNKEKGTIGIFGEAG